VVQLIVGQLLNGIIVGTLYGIIALGVTLTFGITGIVNFALGAFMAIGAYAAWYLTDSLGITYPLAVPIAVAAVAVMGLLVDQSLFRFTRNNLINGLIVSIGLISVIESVLLLVWTTTPKNMHYVLPGVISLKDERRRLPRAALGNPLDLRCADPHLGRTCCLCFRPGA
jgi:branched-chain amino acid transport system permease protein